jgi:hypothetical protein
MSTENHTLYKSRSPYYDSIVARYGRMIPRSVALTILHDHGTTEAEYTADIGAAIPLPAMPESVDASDLLAWLGY